MTFEPERNTTKLIWNMQVEARGVFSVAERFLKRQAEETFVTDLEVLRRLLEADAARAPRPWTLARCETLCSSE